MARKQRKARKQSSSWSLIAQANGGDRFGIASGKTEAGMVQIGKQAQAILNDLEALIVMDDEAGEYYFIFGKDDD